MGIGKTVAKKSPGYQLRLVGSSELTGTLTLEVSFQSGLKKPSAFYTFDHRHESENREPRGRCLIGTRTSEPKPKDKDHLPEMIMGRFPDIELLKNEGARLKYLDTFNKELGIELTVLKRLESLGGHIALRLPNEDVIPKLSFTSNGAPGATGVLLCRYVEGISLREWCKKYRKGWREPVQKWFDFANDLTKAVHLLHLAGAPHGYICPDNVIVEDTKTLSKPKLINLEWDTPDPALHVDWKPTSQARTTDVAKLCWRRPYDAPDKIRYYHEISDSSETYDPFVPGDIFSIGLTLLYLASDGPDGIGETLHPFSHEKEWKVLHEGQWKVLPWNQVSGPMLKTDERIKHEILGRLKEGFYLPNVKKGGNLAKDEKSQYESIVKATEVIFACLRLSESRLYNVRSILDVLGQFAISPGSMPPDPVSPDIKTAFKTLSGQSQPQLRTNSLVAALYRERLYHNIRPLLEADNKVTRFTAGHSREEIVDALTGLLLQIGNGWTCRALITPTFWFAGNCDPVGPSLSALKIAAVRGCKVTVMILLNEARMNVPEVVHVMNQHRRALRELTADVGANAIDNYQWGWHLLPSNRYKEFLRTSETFIDLSGPGKERVVVIPDFASEAGQIIALRAFPVRPNEASRPRWRTLQKTFKDNWKMRLEIEQFPHR